MKIKDYLPEKNEGVYILDYKEYSDKSIYNLSEEFIEKKADIFIFLRDEKVEYLLTNTDLIEIMLQHSENMSLKELKTEEPKSIIFLRENDNIIEAYNLMRRQNIEHLIVLDENDKFAGLLTYKYLALFLTNIALKDELTKLYNRRFLDFILDKYEMAESEIGVLFIDCDFFKEVNDTYGHKKGDEILQTISKTIRHSIRDIDYPFRYGGDEFVILVFTTYEITKKIADRILNKLKEQNISVSIGVAHYPTCGNNLKDVLIKADHQMYKAKIEKGRVESC